LKTYKFQLFPNTTQKDLLWSHAKQLNFLYNHFLNLKIEAYNKDKTNLSQSDLQSLLPILKEQKPELKKIHSQVLQQIAIRLDNAYKAFFRRVKEKKTNSKSKDKCSGCGFPNFRPSYKFFGICYPQKGFYINDNIFKTKAYGEIKFRKIRNILGNIKQIYIKCDVFNHWSISITTDYEDLKDSTGNAVGIDIGLKNLVVTNLGDKIKNCSHAKYFDKIIDQVKSEIDKSNKGSRKRRRLGKLKSRLYELKNRKISDFQHKVSRNLVRKYDTIFIEDLSAKKMSESDKTNLNKALRNARLVTFLSYIKYKGNTVIEVNPYNTSKTCNNCGYIHEKLKLSERTITCKECGNTYDRDENAAKNIYCLGQAIFRKGCDSEVTLREALTLR
jgi:putative transposase